MYKTLCQVFAMESMCSSLRVAVAHYTCILNAKQNILRVKKVRGQSEAEL